MATNVSFAGNSLQTANILTNTIDHFSLPAKDIKLYALAHANRSTIPFQSYPNKSIVIKGVIIDTTIAALDSRIDTFKSYFLNQDQNLDIDYNGSTRRYIATANNVTVDRPGGLLYAEFEVDLICTQPFGQDTGSTTALSASGRTNSSYNDSYTFLGTAPYQLPVFTLTYQNVATSATSLITNPGFEVDLSGWSSGGVGTATRVTAQHNTGVAAMQMVNAGSAVGGNFGWEYTLQSGFTVGNTYTISCFLKGSAGGEVVNVSVAGTTASKNVTLTTNWQQVFLTFTAVATTSEIDFKSTSPASGTWFLDDVNVYASASAYVFLGNNNNGQGVFITRTWSADDVLVVDCLNKTVTVNGTPVNFTGAFPEFPPGSQSIGYVDTFTTRSFNISGTYNVLYL